eukprot:RCo052317
MACAEDPLLAERGRALLKDLQRREQTAEWEEHRKQQCALPMERERENILEALRQNQVLVIQSETGAGKTTQVPQYIAEEMIRSGRGGELNLVCTQPRRISAISVAQRVQEELSSGGEGEMEGLVGYQVRLQRNVSQNTQILFCTTGILLRKLQGDPELKTVTHVIVDEVHEMSVQSDFLLIILRNLLPRNPTLRVILMSATINAARFCSYFGGCAAIFVEGRLYPVVDLYLEDVVEHVGHAVDQSSPCANRQAFHKPVSEELQRLAGAYRKSTIETLHRLDLTRINFELIEQLLVFLCQLGAGRQPGVQAGHERDRGQHHHQPGHCGQRAQ